MWLGDFLRGLAIAFVTARWLWAFLLLVFPGVQWGANPAEEALAVPVPAASDQRYCFFSVPSRLVSIAAFYIGATHPPLTHRSPSPPPAQAPSLSD